MRIEETLAGPLQPRTGVTSAIADVFPNIFLGGVRQFAYWADHVYADPGEAVVVSREVDPNGSARNYVVGRVGQPQPTSGTVASATGSSAVVSLGAGTVTARYNSGLSLSAGDTVALLWQGRIATVTAKLTDYVPPPVEAAPSPSPPPAPKTGTLSAFATDTATWVPGLGVWNAWAGGNQNVYQGSWSGYTTYGSCFYNGQTKQLAGATVTRVLLRIPKRLSVGAYNNAATIHVYVHTSNNRPGGDVARVLGPYNFTIPAQYAGNSTIQSGVPKGWVSLPVAAGTQLAGGGGISISGEPYMGFVGKATDPSAFQLLTDWQR